MLCPIPTQPLFSRFPEVAQRNWLHRSSGLSEVHGIAIEGHVRVEQRHSPVFPQDKLVRSEKSRREKPSRGRELQAENTPVRVSVLGNNPERRSDSSPDAVRSFSLCQRSAYPSEGQQDWADQLP